MSSSAPIRGRLFVRPARLPVVASAMLLCLAAPVLSHRLIVAPEARAQGAVGAEAVQEALEHTPVPV